MSGNSVGASVAVRSGRGVSAAALAALAVLTGLLVVVGSGAGASSSSPSSSSPFVSSTPAAVAAVGAVGVSGAASAGRYHSVVVGDDGVAYGTGNNDYGELTGTGDRATLTALTGLPAGVRGIATAAGNGHTLVVGDDGMVYGTGLNIFGQLTGTGDRTTLTALTGLPAGVRGVAAAAGAAHTLVVGDDGMVYGTGYNSDAQLTGTGNKATLTALTGLPAGVRGVAVAAGWYHSLVVGDDGVVYGTGDNFYGQLTGTGNTTTLTALTGLPSGVRGVAAAAGISHSLVVGDDGVVYGTGRNNVGQLTGTGDRTTLTALTGLPAGVRGVGLAAGDLHTLVVGDDGVVYGTGSNNVGQLTGTGDKATLTALTGLPAAVRGGATAAGYEHSLVVGDDGVVYGTGYNFYGQLTGTGDRTTLTALTGLPADTPAPVAAGSGHSVAIGADGLPYGTGLNDFGQLTGTGDRTTLTALTGLPAGVRGVAVAAGYEHSLVLGDDGVVYGTGRNNYGQLTGTGDKTTLTALTGLPAGVRGIAVAAGSFHSLVVGDDGVVYGTGRNNIGQLTGTGDKTTLTPLTGLPAGVRGIAAAAGDTYTLVVGDDGVVYGTGNNSNGQLTGTGNKATLTALTGLPAGVRGVATAAGYYHSLVVGDDGVVYGTGYNGQGQLTGTGNKTTLTALTGLPAGVRGIAAAASIYHSLVVGNDGVVYGTGYNGQGQLTGTGNKTTLTALTGLPTDITAPAVSLNPVASPTGDSTPTFTGTGGRAAGDEATATLKIWQGPDTSGTLLHTYPGITIDFWYGNWTGTVPGPDALPDGTYTARAFQDDTAGNTGQSTTRTFTVDTGAPVVSGVSSTTVNGSYTVGELIAVQVTFTEPVTVTGTPRLTLETGTTDAVADYTSGTGTDTLTFSYTVATGHTTPDLDYTNTGALTLAGGTIRDAAANNATLTLPTPATPGSLGANKNLVIDTTAPQTTIDTGPVGTTNDPTATFTFSSDEAGSTFACRLDTEPWAACTSPHTTPTLAEGSHTLAVRATDTAANTDPTPATRTFTVDTTTPDTTAPDTTITKHPTKKTFKRKAKFAFTSSEPGSTFQCKVDRKPWKTCTSPYKVKVKPGKHKFQVRAIDAAGNIDPTPALWKWTVKPRS